MAKNYLSFHFLFLILSLNSTAQTVTGSFTYDGSLRDYRVHLPPGYNVSESMPLVLNLHGLGSNAIQQEAYTQFDVVGDTARFIIVYPNAIGNEWNISGAGVDDVGFLSALIDTIQARYNIDLSRIYSTGMSMGGFMSYRLACELTCRIAAIASVTGLLATSPCNASRPIAVMQIHGTNDPTVPYSGVNPSIQSWLQKNNCPTTPVISNLPDVNTTDSSTVTKSYYGLCDDSTEVILYTINGGEHTWPDALIDIAITNKDFNASSTIWNFFKSYRLNNDILANNGCDTLPLVSSIHSISTRNISHRIYPNPSSGEAILSITSRSSKSITFCLYNIFGKEIQRIENITVPAIKIPVGKFSTGIYSYHLFSDGSMIGSGKMITR